MKKEGKYCWVRGCFNMVKWCFLVGESLCLTDNFVFTTEEEEKKRCFSPELPFSLATEKACRESFPHHCHLAPGEESRYSARIEAVTGESQNLSLIPSEEPYQERTENPKNIDIIGADICISTSRNENSNQISVGDVLCASCEELLVQPVVLNCGHGKLCVLYYKINFYLIGVQFAIFVFLCNFSFMQFIVNLAWIQQMKV